ncbi:MAG TPA: DUF6519 domain-containing protein [Allosphingosinicella sp.]|jgi:hypothetical protein
MRGDFSRYGFSPRSDATGLNYQQGRLTLDSDSNLAQAIQLHQVRALAEHLIGPFGGVGDSFKLTPLADLPWDVGITPGDYYVAGCHCRNWEPVTWRGTRDRKRQPWLGDQPQPRPVTHLAYLELWERHVDAAEFEGLREVALGGPATVGLRQMVWTVRLREWPGNPAAGSASLKEKPALEVLRGWISGSRGMMAARARTPAAPASDPCLVSPRASYRGTENQLYRIEIYRGGSADKSSGQDRATFVWSRDNASIVLPVESVGGTEVKLASAWRDARSDVAAGDHVEISDETVRMGPGAGPIRRVTAYDPDSSIVTLDEPAGPAIEAAESGLLLRRWDHKRGDPRSGYPPLADDHGLLVVEDEWLTIEDGISIRFAAGAPGHVYRAGDYWMIQARTDLADIIWPRDDGAEGTPRAVPPDGVQVLHAPLAAVTFDGQGIASATDLRRVIRQAAQPA